jgi:hypothetical protein
LVSARRGREQPKIPLVKKDECQHAHDAARELSRLVRRKNFTFPWYIPTGREPSSRS